VKRNGYQGQAKGKGHRAVVRKQTTENRCQTTEVREQSVKGNSQKADDRCQTTESKGFQYHFWSYPGEMIGLQIKCYVV